MCGGTRGDDVRAWRCAIRCAWRCSWRFQRPPRAQTDQTLFPCRLATAQTLSTVPELPASRRARRPQIEAVSTKDKQILPAVNAWENIGLKNAKFHRVAVACGERGARHAAVGCGLLRGFVLPWWVQA